MPVSGAVAPLAPSQEGRRVKRKNWIGKSKARLSAILNRGRVAAIRICYLMAFTMIGMGVVIPMLTPSSGEGDGGAGGMAPFLALSAAVLFLIHHLRSESDRFAWWANFIAGVSLVFSAYYWLASDSEAHPYSSEFLASMAIIMLVLLGVSAFMLVAFGWVWFSQRDKED